MDDAELVRLIVKAFKEKELLRIGNRSYINAFKYPESRFDLKDLLPNGGSLQVLNPSPIGQILTDPSKLFTDKYIIPPTSLIFKWADRIYEKKWWGELAGGIPDTSKVMQSSIALLVGGTMVIKADTYIIPSTVDIGPNGISIYGEEWSATVLKAKDGLNAPIFKVDATTEDRHDITFKNFKIDGNKANQTAGNAIEIVSASPYRLDRFTFENLQFKDVYAWAIRLNNTSYDNTLTRDFDFRHIWIRDSSGGIYMTALLAVNINSVWITDFSDGYAGIRADKTSSVITMNGVIASTTPYRGCGFYLNIISNSYISNCHAYGCIEGFNIKQAEFLPIMIANSVAQNIRDSGWVIDTGLGDRRGWIYLVNCEAGDCSRAGVGAAAGFWIRCREVKLLNCKIYDAAPTPYMYGVSLYADSDLSTLIALCTFLNLYAPKAGVGTATFKHNTGYTTENSGVATFSGDGVKTEFDIGAHGLAESPTNPSRIYAEGTPVSPDAQAGSPCEVYPVDLDADGNYEALRVKFASAPPAGTDNVKVRWKAELY